MMELSNTNYVHFSYKTHIFASHCSHRQSFTSAPVHLQWMDDLVAHSLRLVTPNGNRSWSTLVQVMACGLTASSHDLNQCWHDNIGLLPRSFACSADVLSAEVLWSIKCIDSHYSYHSNEHISDTFQSMFPDSVIASKFSCGETKSSYLIRYGIGPYMKTLLQHRVKEDDYVLLFDESLNREMQKKQLDILVRLWDNDCIQSRFFHSQFLGHASAHNLVEACIESVSVLNVRNIVQISMDGPNVNWSFYNKFENIIQDQCSKTLLPTGSCGLHQIHNAFRFGSSQSDWNIDSYLSSLYYLFHDSPARRDDYEQGSHMWHTLYQLKKLFCRFYNNIY